MPKRKYSKTEAKNPPTRGNEIVADATEEDIFVGRGFQFEAIPGNAMFFSAVQACVAEYNAATSRGGKTAIVRRLYEELSSTSRFLRHDATTGLYHVVSAKKAKQKISHALRYQSQMQDEATTEDSKLPATSTSTNESSTISSEGTQEDAKPPARQSSSDYTEQLYPMLQQSSSDETSSLFSDDLLESALGSSDEFVAQQPDRKRRAIGRQESLEPSGPSGDGQPQPHSSAAASFPPDMLDFCADWASDGGFDGLSSFREDRNP